MTPELKQQIVKEYQECKDRVYIANKYSISTTTVSNYTKQLGFNTFSLSDKVKKSILLPKEKQIIEGLLLGDGGIYPNPKTCNLVIGSINKDYIEFLTQELKLFTNRKITMSHRRPNEKPFYTCKSKNDKSLTDYRVSWYTPIKEVPSNFVLTPISLLHWFIGDGYIAKNTIGFCTDSFNKTSVDLLINQLSNLDIKSKSTIIKNRNSSGHRIFIYEEESRKEFYKVIGRCPVNSFNYKWSTNH